MRGIIIGIIFLLCPFSVYSEQNIPQITSGVNDFAGLLGPEYTEKINAQIEELKQTEEIEFSVVTVVSMNGYSEDEYTGLLWKNWESVQKNKAILVLLAAQERRWRIDVGSSVKGLFSDDICDKIGNNYMVPYFKENSYGEGMYQGVLELSKVVSFKNEVAAEGIRLTDAFSGNSVLLLVVFLTGTLFILFLRRKKKCCCCSATEENSGISPENKEN